MKTNLYYYKVSRSIGLKDEEDTGHQIHLNFGLDCRPMFLYQIGDQNAFRGLTRDHVSDLYFWIELALKQLLEDYEVRTLEVRG